MQIPATARLVALGKQAPGDAAKVSKRLREVTLRSVGLVPSTRDFDHARP